ncbi:MAG: hypothetical protein LBN33_08020 [Desulfovibrio sp.]|jgi:anti-anti-sigma regulatory factor|nr:hypothetical protein [Desulfovibrio sp.]
MDDVTNSDVLEGLSDLLTLSLGESKSGSPYACRSFSAYSGERHTAYGRFHDRISLSNNTEFRSALYGLVGENTNNVILDFKDAFMTRSTLGTLVAFAASMHGRNVRMYIYRPAMQIKAALIELKLASFFRFLNSEDDVTMVVLV